MSSRSLDGESLLHHACEVGSVQWHRLDTFPYYYGDAAIRLEAAARDLRQLELTLQEQAAAILEREGLTDWRVSLHITSTR